MSLPCLLSRLLLLRVRRATRTGLPVMLFALLLLATPAMAHKIVISAWPLGEEIEGEVGFSSGEMAAPGTQVEILGPNGQVFGEVAVDDEGLFRFRPTQAVPHTLRANLGAGHVAEMTLAVDELPDIVPPVTQTANDGGPAQEGQMPADGAKPSAGTQPAPVASAVRPDALGGLIATAVQREIRPLRRELTRLRESQRVHDVLGGLGYITGIFGLLFFVYARRQPRAHD